MSTPGLTTAPYGAQPKNAHHRRPVSPTPPPVTFADRPATKHRRRSGKQRVEIGEDRDPRYGDQKLKRRCTAAS